MIRFKRAQTILEYTILLTIIIGVFVAMQSYVKRGIQGRWKTSIDDFGEQYDPRYTNGIMNYKIVANSSTQIWSIKDTNGYWTQRKDNSQSTSTAVGSSAVGSSF